MSLPPGEVRPEPRMDHAERWGDAGGASAPGRLPAVASLALRPLLFGSLRAVRELARFSQAIYLVVDDGPPAPRSSGAVPRACGSRAHAWGSAPVIALLSPAATAVPGGLQLTTAQPWWARPPGAGPRAAVAGTVGDGGLSIGDRRVTVCRWWDPVPRLAPTSAAALRARADRVAPLLRAGPTDPSLAHLRASLSAVCDGLERADDEAAVTAADALIGLGPGLTPAGDDLLAGLLASIAPLWTAVAATGDLAASAAIPVAARRVAVAVAERAVDGTTTVSAELLRHAATGAVARPVLTLLRALGGHGPLEPAVHGLLAVGSSSGRDLARGVLAAARLTARHAATSPLRPTATATGPRPVLPARPLTRGT
ncbi:MAG: DUF2877 domain-containing protein [Nitriliruptoraceae bacterium]|nr:DUF2877 domain-containing protein [Nitriliruptoraceae bacterium]